MRWYISVQVGVPYVWGHTIKHRDPGQIMGDKFQAYVSFYRVDSTERIEDLKGVSFQ